MGCKVSYTVKLCKEEKEFIEDLLANYSEGLADEKGVIRVDLDTLATLFEVKNKLEKAVKCYS